MPDGGDLGLSVHHLLDRADGTVRGGHGGHVIGNTMSWLQNIVTI